jgi:hypothetical protein
MVAIPNIKLSSGHDMPQVGFGLWKVDNAVASDVVYEAIKAGYRLFDGACGESLARSAVPSCLSSPQPPCGNTLECQPIPVSGSPKSHSRQAEMRRG